MCYFSNSKNKSMVINKYVDANFVDIGRNVFLLSPRFTHVVVYNVEEGKPLQTDHI